MSNTPKTGFSGKTWAGIFSAVLVAIIGSAFAQVMTNRVDAATMNARQEEREIATKENFDKLDAQMVENEKRDRELTDAIHNLNIATALLRQEVQQMREDR